MKMFLNIPLYSSHRILHVPSIRGLTSFSSPSFALDSLCILKELLLSKFSLFVSLFFHFLRVFPCLAAFFLFALVFLIFFGFYSLLSHL